LLSKINGNNTVNANTNLSNVREIGLINPEIFPDMINENDIKIVAINISICAFKFCVIL
jgi:hypothetical protein